MAGCTPSPDTATKHSLKSQCGCLSLTNVTDLQTWLLTYNPLGLPTPPYAGCANTDSPPPPAPISPPFTRGDIECAPDYARDPCRLGPWDIALYRRTQQFAAKDPAKVPCPATKGEKFAVANKIHDGRNGFVQDYITYPRLATTHYRQFTVEIGYSEDGKNYFYEADITCMNQVTRSNAGTATSQHTLTAGGVDGCIGGVSCGDGSANISDSNGNSLDSLTCGGCPTPPWSPCTADAPDGLLGIPSDVNNTDPTGTRASNVTFLKWLCNINSERGNIGLNVPHLGTYSGPASGLAAWLASWNFDEIVAGGAHAIQSYSLTSFSLSNTSLTGTVKYLNTYDQVWPAFGAELTRKSEYTFTFSVTLSDDYAYTFAQAQADATALLNNFDFTNDKDFPWTMPSDCRIAPMISRWETGGQPGTGYCDTPADPTQTAIYDGSVKGALINYYKDAGGVNYKSGVYSKGWFDFSMWIYNYTADPDNPGAEKLCYNYGAYPSDIQGVSMATQVTTGSMDTSDRGNGWSPFSRYYEGWSLSFRPPFVDVSCGFAADGGDAIYVSKYAEKKVNLPAENLFGPCGAMRLQTLLDSQCNPTATLRFPGAWSICGKCAVASITRDSGSGVVTVTLTDPADALIDGDAVDFLDASNNVTTANVTASHVDSPTQFHFTGALPTGVAIKSHGAPDPAWADPSPKGDFVWAFDSGNAYDAPGTPDVQSVQQDNLAKTGGILFVGPPGSPEITNPASAAKWPSATTRIMSTCYATIEPGGHSNCQPVQAMEDRFFTPQDNTMNDSSGGAPGICIALVPRPLPRWVEARLTAPAHAPFDFSGGDGNKYLKLPVAAELCYNFNCSGIWNATFAFTSLPYGSWPGAIKSSGALASQDVTGASASDDITNLGPA
jgi:hypothetical protein